MNNALEFVLDKTEGLVSNFKCLKASVYFETLTNAYYIELKPLDAYADKALKKERLRILSEFYAHNFNAILNFVNEESLLELSDYQYVLTGSEYIDINKVVNFYSISRKKLNNEVDIIDEEPIVAADFNNYALAA